MTIGVAQRNRLRRSVDCARKTGEKFGGTRRSRLGGVRYWPAYTLDSTAIIYSTLNRVPCRDTA